jgi:alpha-glucoside transport system substrate-binding protein
MTASCATSTADERSVEVFGPYVGVEADAFAASMETFEETTGIAVRYTGSVDFTSDLRERVASGLDAPDVALVPQPGLISELSDGEDILPLSDRVTAAVEEHHGAEPEELQAGGEGYVVPYRTSVKSLVWFRPETMAEHGWEVPRTWQELDDLVDEIRDTDDLAPWCFSIYSGTSTGWPATDWVEDLLLRSAGVDAYDAWVSGEIGFDDPQVRAAFDNFDDHVLQRGASAGGLRTILQTEVSEAWQPLFDNPSGCVLYKQASFASSWFPSGIDIGPDGALDFFVLPGMTDTEPAPLVIAGDGAVQFDTDPDTELLMAYLATPESGRAWANVGGYTSARITTDPDDYVNDADRRVAALLTEDRERRFPASDLMPPEIGSGLLWENMTAWIAGTRSYDEIAEELDSARREASPRSSASGS